MPADPVREAAEAPTVACAVFDLADQAIGLFLSYRDQHGHTEDSAARQAATDIAEGATADVPGSAGWQLAPPGSVVVQLPAPEDVTPVCGCGVPPDGAPTALGCCRECMEPALVFFPGGISLDLQAGAIYDGSGRTYEAEMAAQQAARLLSAVAMWEAYREATPAPEPGGQW